MDNTDETINTTETNATEPSIFDSRAVEAAFQSLLNAGIEEHFGQEKHAVEGRNSGNSRNGKNKKKVRGDSGELEIETHRDRESSFEPRFIKKRQTSVGNFTDKIVSLYARGMTTREIEEHLREMYGIDVSPQFVTRATENECRPTFSNGITVRWTACIPLCMSTGYS